MKFGGTSVKNAELINNVVGIVKTKSEKTVVVVSAIAGVTDCLETILDKIRMKRASEAYFLADSIHDKHYSVIELLGLGPEAMKEIDYHYEQLRKLIYALGILGEVSEKSISHTLSFGEKMSACLVFYALKKEIPETAFIKPEGLIITDSNYSDISVLFQETENAIRSKCEQAFEMNDVIITSGFVGSTIDGQIITLGRGGSDFSASIIASALNADRLEIWTDVDGILTSDPRIIKNVKRVRELSYNEASELAYFGAKVLHPKTILPAVDKNIPVYVLNTYNPISSGTMIVRESANIHDLKSIAYRKDVTVINIHSSRMLGAYGFLSKVFNVFSKFQTSVDLITTSEVNISLTTENDDMLDDILKELKDFSNVEIFQNKAIISAVGEGIRYTAGIGARFFGALKGVNVSMVSMGASEVNLSIIIDNIDLDTAVEKLHEEFFAGPVNEDVFEELTSGKVNRYE